MPALNFKKKLAGLVETGVKGQTIRAPRKRPIKPGDKLYLYTGMRTKYCRKLKDAVCREVKKVLITETDVYLMDQKLDQEEKIKFAILDGFSSFFDLLDFFKENHGLPFVGDVIYWD